MDLTFLTVFFLHNWVFVLIVIILSAIYYHYTNTFNFFKKKGVKFMNPTILIGNTGTTLMNKRSFHDFQIDVYNYFKDVGYGGVFLGRQPVLYITDPDLVKAVTIRDFDHFIDRLSLDSNEPRYLQRILLNLKGGDWKAVRSAVTPAFSSSRLKYMLNLIDERGQQMIKYLKQFDETGIEMKDAMGRFTLEVIGACAFGITSDSLTEQNARFLKVAENYDFMPLLKKIKVYFVLLFIPELSKQLDISFLDEDNIAELIKMLKETKSQRRLNSTANKHGDFLQLLLDAAEKEISENNNSSICLDDDTIDAQSVLFLLAGFETSSSLLSCSILVLAQMPEIQDKLRAHILEEASDKEMTYEMLSQLDYLEAFLLETLRRYPPISRIDRVCVKPYVLPGTSVRLNVGDVIAVPLIGIQMDPKHYDEPEEFRPDRFMRDGKVIKPSHTFLAFGSGPRNCIGMRFAMFSAKCAMVHLLKNFKFSVCSKTVYPIEYETNSVFLKAKSGIWVKLKKIDTNV